MHKTSGQLAIKTIHGRNGPFNVGRLQTSLYEAFKVKDAMLEQYKQGKYDGEFVIKRLYPFSYTTGGVIVVEIRAVLDSMVLSGIDQLTSDEATGISPEERDPIDEESQIAKPTILGPPTLSIVPSLPPPSDPLIDTTPFAVNEGAKETPQAEQPVDADAALFGPLWPLGDTFKLDTTVDRRTLRLQIGRLDKLGWELQPLTQEWHRKLAA